MGKTTLIKKQSEMPRGPLEKCHNGKGTIDWIRVLEKSDFQVTNLRFIHDDVLPPRTSIGIHRHEDDEEYYYVVSGSGVMVLDDKKYTVNAGDITVVLPGGQHGLENTTDEDLRVVVICIAAEKRT